MQIKIIIQGKSLPINIADDLLNLSKNFKAEIEKLKSMGAMKPCDYHLIHEGKRRTIDEFLSIPGIEDWLEDPITLMPAPSLPKESSAILSRTISDSPELPTYKAPALSKPSEAAASPAAGIFSRIAASYKDSSIYVDEAEVKRNNKSAVGLFADYVRIRKIKNNKYAHKELAAIYDDPEAPLIMLPSHKKGGLHFFDLESQFTEARKKTKKREIYLISNAGNIHWDFWSKINGEINHHETSSAGLACGAFTICAIIKSSEILKRKFFEIFPGFNKDALGSQDQFTARYAASMMVYGLLEDATITQSRRTEIEASGNRIFETGKMLESEDLIKAFESLGAQIIDPVEFQEMHVAVGDMDGYKSVIVNNLLGRNGDDSFREELAMMKDFLSKTEHEEERTQFLKELGEVSAEGYLVESDKISRYFEEIDKIFSYDSVSLCEYFKSILSRNLEPGLAAEMPMASAVARGLHELTP